MDELGQVPERRGDETLSPLLRKIIYLTEFRKMPFGGRKILDAVRLYDDGTHGDAAAGDGIYTGQYEGTAVPGMYAFDFNASGRTAAGFPFERNQRLERQLAVKADTLNADIIRLPAEDKQFDLFDITLRPADAYGNLLGPGRQHLILWEATAGEFAQPAIDHLDGTYSRQLRLPSGSKTSSVELTLLIGDSPFRINLGKALKPRHGVPLAGLVVLLFFLALTLQCMLKTKNR
jgi:hypothetical protein